MNCKKIMCAGLSLFTITSLVSCKGTTTIEDTEKEITPETTYHEGTLKANTNGVLDFMLDTLKMAGKSYLNNIILSIAKEGFNSVLKAMGFDTRTVEQKKLDEISTRLDTMQKSIDDGFKNVMRKEVQIYNEQIMNDLLKKIDDVKTPLMECIVTMNLIAENELDDNVSSETITQQKNTFYNKLASLKFVTLSMNELWNATENFAESILHPNPSNTSLTLFDFYEDTFGALETWDTMMVQPRRKFIAYLAYLVNSMAQLSQIYASYKISSLPEGDPSISGINTGINAMLNRVGDLNEYFQTKLKELDAIETKHDEEKVMIHRSRSSDSDGNLVISQYEISSRLFTVTTCNSNNNYVSFTHNEGTRRSTKNNKFWQGYIYTLDCSSSVPLYQSIINEYKVYNAYLGNSNYTSYTIKDYLIDIGFYYRLNNEIGFNRSLGFYQGIFDSDYGVSGGTINHYNNLGVKYYSFQNLDTEGTMCFYSKIHRYMSSIFSSETWTIDQDELTNYYLVFLEKDQKTLVGDIKDTLIESNYLNSKTTYWEKHFKGFRSWSSSSGSKVTLDDEQIDK